MSLTGPGLGDGRRAPVRSARFALAIGAGLAAAAAAQAEDAGRVWSLSGADARKGQPVYFGYGVPDSDDTLAAFSCDAGAGRARLFVAETSVKLKPGRPARATLAAGDARAEVPGKILPNEEAGVPSFEGELDPRDPIFAAMAKAARLSVTVGPSRQSAPLDGVGDKAARFAQKCARP